MIDATAPNLAELPTPCLVVDVAAADRNIARMAAFFAGRSSPRLRPHFKAHKCSTLMRRQVAAGVCAGVTCATAQEAMVLARAGFSDILLANEIADNSNMYLLVEAARLSKLTVAVDHPVHVDLLDRFARSGDVRFDVLIDIDPGTHRTGLAPADPLVIELARAVRRSKCLRFAGIFAYEGHAQMRSDFGERKQLVSEAAKITAHARDRLANAGFASEIVSGGGTGTYELSSDAGVLNEIQAGSYVLMDAAYARLGLPFEIALYCLTTVTSTPSSAAAVVNGGLKAMSFEKGPPGVARSGIKALDLSDEHGKLALDEGVRVEVGERILLIPSHIDPTINLHDVMFAWTESSVEPWTIDGRRHNI